MLTEEQIEARKLRLVELVLTMTPLNGARTDRLEQIALCDMALAHLAACEQEPVLWAFPNAANVQTDFSFYKTGVYTIPLYAAPVPAPSPWVKCSERLPDRDTEVLVFCGWIMSAIYQPAVKRRGNDVWYAEQAGINPVFHVTHWMPLPKPPEAK